MSDPTETTQANPHPVSGHRSPGEIAKDEAGAIGQADLDVVATGAPCQKSPGSPAARRPRPATLSALKNDEPPGCGCSPVVEDTKSLKLAGVVTERDVCCNVAADDKKASEVRVEEIMRPASACCGTDEPVEEARRKLHEHGATTLPVVDKAGGCCGTVSVHDLVRS